MNKYIHQDLAANHWFKMPLSEQLANVGSEFSRAYQAKKKSKEKRFESALLRMIELLNLTLMDPRWTGLRKQEIARLKENILESMNFHYTCLDKITALEKYFYYFGVSRSISKL